MAGGKLTPRQKMINLMYLVFIAMLALNMSKEVLSAFGILNKKIADSNTLVETNNTDLFTQLSAKAEEQAGYYKTKKDKAEQIRNASNEFYTYVEGLKAELTKEYPRDEDGNLPYENMDKGDKLDEMFFEGDKPSKKGQEFLDRIKNYNRSVQQIAGQDMLEETKVKLDKRFATAPVKSKSAGTTLPWLDYNYKGFPVIASVTKLTQLQNDIRVTENELLSGMFLEGTKKMASLSAFEAIVVPDKTAFFAGEKVTGKIILGKKDPNLKAHSVVVNGQTLGPEAMQTGQTLFEFQAGNVGEQDITGQFQFKEGDSIIKLDIKGNYVVVPKPNSATISADKMNSVYRGVQNPMTISFAGISDNNVTASAPGLSKSGKAGKYNWNVNGIQGKTATITVNGTLPDGTKVSDKAVFNVREIPQPAASVRGRVGSSKGNKNDLANSTINVEFTDFVFDVQTTVTSFEVYVPGSPAIICQGNRFNAQALKAISNAQRGDQITINQIKVNVAGAPGYRVRPSTPFIWEVQ